MQKKKKILYRAANLLLNSLHELFSFPQFLFSWHKHDSTVLVNSYMMALLVSSLWITPLEKAEDVVFSRRCGQLKGALLFNYKENAYREPWGVS